LPVEACGVALHPQVVFVVGVGGQSVTAALFKGLLVVVAGTQSVCRVADAGCWREGKDRGL
jgi:hypothetical protein